jgi:hypothetical protein
MIPRPKKRQSDRQFDMQFGQRSVRQGSKVAAGPSTCGDWKLRRISDGLASRVKGLTADFCVLLVTNPAPPRRLAVFSPSVAAAAKRLWWRQACDFRRRPVPPAIIRNQAGHGRPATPRPGRVLSVRRSPRFHRALSDRQGPARLPERVHCPSGSRISMTSTPVSIAWQRRRPPTWTRFRRSKIHHSMSPNDLCPVCVAGRRKTCVATPVLPVQIRILQARALTTRSP